MGISVYFLIKKSNDSYKFAMTEQEVAHVVILSIPPLVIDRYEQTYV